MIAAVFPGQGAQFAGMGRTLYESNSQARNLFEQANTALDMRLTDLMFEGTDQDLKQTHITQPAVFVHAVVVALTQQTYTFDAVAGHSLGEFSALVVAGALDFLDGLRLVSLRAHAMHRACLERPSTMAAVLGMEDAHIERICSACNQDHPDEVVVPANYNTVGQLVISGSAQGVALASERLLAQGAKRVVPLSVAGAFHSPLMEPAKRALAEAIDQAPLHTPRCPIYQNVSAAPTQEVTTLRKCLIQQLTAPVRWHALIERMYGDGMTHFVECGSGRALQNMIRKIAPHATRTGME